MRRAAGAATAALVLSMSAGCRQDAPAGVEGRGHAVPAAATPVRAVPVGTADLDRIVSGTGHTVALVQQRVRPPFAGVLTELLVLDGDRVRRGEILGSIVSRDSQAALEGAREMVREARTPREKADAERAVALARRDLVLAKLESPADGSVLSHTANSGDRVTEDQDILTLSAANSLAFQADVPQSDLSRVRAGESAVVELSGRPASLSGAVHDVLPSANAVDLTVPVRIDLPETRPPLPVGLFGTAKIRIGSDLHATVVPSAAVLRDDITGKSRIAMIEVPGEGKGPPHARWKEVTTGLVQSGLVEILAPPLPAGTRVIVAGQVGLPDGAPVALEP